MAPVFGSRDDLLKSICHIYSTTPFPGWHEKLNSSLGALKLDNLMRLGSVEEALGVCSFTLGQALSFDHPTFIKKLINKYKVMQLSYPDNGDQNCRYWLLKVGDVVDGPDGTPHKVTAYQPAAQPGQPPSITLEPINGKI